VFHTPLIAGYPCALLSGSYCLPRADRFSRRNGGFSRTQLGGFAALQDVQFVSAQVPLSLSDTLRFQREQLLVFQSSLNFCLGWDDTFAFYTQQPR